MNTNEAKETLRIIPYAADGLDMLDVRIWKNTKKGPRPTKNGFVIRELFLTRMIAAMQGVHRQRSRELAEKTAAK